MPRLRRLSAALCLLLLALASPARAADRIFDSRVLHEVRLVMDPSDWEALRANFRLNDYYAANISFDGEVVEQVGIRSRGKGSRDSVKPGLRVDFNRYGKARDFHGLTSLALKNELQDPSFLREALAMQVFEAMGFPAPAGALARVTVNDEYWGVYLLSEEIRAPFVAARFGEDSGNLFKYEWNGSWDFSWRGESPAEYVPLPFEPHTNEDNLDPSRLVDLVNVINNVPDEELQVTLAYYLDAKKFLTYLAVENALAQSDGFVGDFGMNNFYVYEKADGVFELIPWDQDNSLQDVTWPIFRRTDENVLSRRLFQEVAMQAVYVGAVARCASDYVNERWLLPRLESLYALVRNAAIADEKKPYTNEEFEIAVDGLRGIIRGRQADVESQLR